MHPRLERTHRSDRNALRSGPEIVMMVEKVSAIATGESLTWKIWTA